MHGMNPLRLFPFFFIVSIYQISTTRTVLSARGHKSIQAKPARLAALGIKASFLHSFAQSFVTFGKRG